MSSGKLLVLLASVLSVSLMLDAQFFTKMSSKSIPRMGRRSDSSVTQHIAPMQMSNLLDVYGPQLIEALLKEQKARNLKSGESALHKRHPLKGSVKYPNKSASTNKIRHNRYQPWKRVWNQTQNNFKKSYKISGIIV